MSAQPLNAKKLLKKLWEVEEHPFNDERVLSVEEQFCENLFNETTTRDSAGKFIVRLPFNEKKSELGESSKSKQVALKRFNHLEAEI